MRRGGTPAPAYISCWFLHSAPWRHKNLQWSSVTIWPLCAKCIVLHPTIKLTLIKQAESKQCPLLNSFAHKLSKWNHSLAYCHRHQPNIYVSRRQLYVRFIIIKVSQEQKVQKFQSGSFSAVHQQMQPFNWFARSVHSDKSVCHIKHYSMCLFYKNKFTASVIA